LSITVFKLTTGLAGGAEKLLQRTIILDPEPEGIQIDAELAFVAGYQDAQMFAIGVGDANAASAISLGAEYSSMPVNFDSFSHTKPSESG